MELGPKQRKWVEILKTTQEKQGSKALCRITEQEERCYCCLGIAAKFVLEAKENTVGKTLVAFFKEKTDNEATGYLSNELASEMGFKGSAQNILARMNDQGKPFPEIAEYIESHADELFERSV